MRGLVAVAWREIKQRRMFLVAALLASLVSWAVPLARGLSGTDAAAARHLTAWILAAAFAVVIVCALGATMLAPSIANRRIAFDFARPLSAFAIWGGRFFAAMALAVAVALIVWLPTGIGEVSSFPLDLPDPRWVVALLAVVCLAALFAIAHATSVVILSRSSAWVIDLGIIAAVTALLMAARRHVPIPTYADSWPLLLARGAVDTAIGLAVITAGYVSIARGRTDIRAAHRALSVALWVPIGALALGIYGYTRWAEAADPSSLSRLWRANPSSGGDWVVVGGRAHGFPAVFLYDTSSGRFARLGADDAWPAFSRDGRRAAWVRGEHPPLAVWTMDLAGPAVPPVRTRILLHDAPSLVVLSADGSRLATVEKGVLSIHDVDSSRTLVSARVADEDIYPRGFFVSRDLFRFYRVVEVTRGEARLDILELDVATRGLEPTGSSPLLSSWCHLAADARGERLIVVDNQRKETWLLDGRSGRLLSALAPPVPGRNRWTGFLADGRAVITDDASDGKLLRVFTADGSPASTVAFPGAAGLALGGEVAPGKVVAAVGEGAARQIEVVDLDTGERRVIGQGLLPAANLSTFWNQPNDAPAVGSNATRLFLRTEESLVRLDPATGDRRVLLGKGER